MRRGDAPVGHVHYLDACGPYSQAQGYALYLCGGGPTPLPAPPPNPDTVALNGVPNHENFDNRNFILRIEQALGDFKLTSITNYESGHWSQAQDSTGTPGDFLDLYGELAHQQIGEELRLASDPQRRLSTEQVLGAVKRSAR